MFTAMQTAMSFPRLANSRRAQEDKSLWAAIGARALSAQPALPSRRLQLPGAPDCLQRPAACDGHASTSGTSNYARTGWGYLGLLPTPLPAQRAEQTLQGTLTSNPHLCGKPVLVRPVSPTSTVVE